jgi:hypothetical protein
MVGQVLIAAVQNSVDRPRLGIAMAATSFFRGLGGAIGAAVFGAIFAAQAGTGGTGSGLSMLGGATRSDMIDGVQSVFLAAAPIALIALVIVLWLREVPLATGAAGRASSGGNRSLPLDRARGLAGDIQHHPTDRADLARHP